MADETPSTGGTGSAVALFFAGLVVLFVLAMPIVMHVSQKRHDVLPWDPDVAFPPAQTLVGGEVFASTLAEIMDHELHSGTGWRPNDFFLWGPRLWADNNANRQLGILIAVRESLRVMKDHLTKVSSDQYDANLLEADTEFRNDERKLFFPSAESRYSAAVAKLRAYVAGLKPVPPTSKPLNRRNVELMRLFQAWGDLLGDAHGSLYRSDVAWLEIDDVFYRAQGIAYVLSHLSRAVGREYAPEFTRKPILHTMLDEVTVALGQAGAMKPFVVLNGAPNGIFANHRRNLDAYITEARQKIYSIREELEK